MTEIRSMSKFRGALTQVMQKNAVFLLLYFLQRTVVSHKKKTKKKDIQRLQNKINVQYKPSSIRKKSLDLS